MLKDLVLQNRSYRRFYQEKNVDRESLVELVELTRFCPSGRNAQPLKYFISNSEPTNSHIFSNLAWAAYLKEWNGPEEGERPSAYILILEDQTIATSSQRDQGIMAQTIMLGAAEKGLGGCIIASVKGHELAKILGIPDHLKIVLALALGYPKEHVVIEPMPQNGNIEYWRDDKGVHHVPKRDLSELIWNKTVGKG
ncbi:MAG: nitroreductase family protein [Bacteroidales bacterium]|jgi:nitroreductase|nr:nitroreductase family protein [Bacteroidales bacterium]HNT40704.1 nitroreductase family protein [Tenuifilaceae bacterium]MBP8644015.1 nitroreductase family protein [Bacteroidales bacterium]NLI87072.1 nitroreductase family protein [Bacteroidales bacterium]HOA10443.1 nitroreductase family protein [Tenuifilaceae bacterium]